MLKWHGIFAKRVTVSGIWEGWTPLWRVFVPEERERESAAVKRFLRARWRHVSGLVPVASGCQNLTISPYWSRFQAIGWPGVECALRPYFTGIC